MPKPLAALIEYLLLISCILFHKCLNSQLDPTNLHTPLMHSYHYEDSILFKIVFRSFIHVCMFVFHLYLPLKWQRFFIHATQHLQG